MDTLISVIAVARIVAPITGGYFSFSLNSYLTSGNQVVDISIIGTELDSSYLEQFPYALYVTSTTSYQVNDVSATKGSHVHLPSLVHIVVLLIHG